MARITIGALFEAYESAVGARIRRDTGQGGESYGLALCAQVALSMILKKCRTEIEVPDIKLNSVIAFLTEEGATLNCGCEGSCPACCTGEVDNHKCNCCGAEFCSECHGITNDVKSENVLPCKCGSN